MPDRDLQMYFPTKELIQEDKGFVVTKIAAAAPRMYYRCLTTLHATGWVRR